jgi:type II secretory pathway pseudopilin PulG
MVRRSRHRGTTLIEVLIALLIATVGLLGALAMLGSLVGGTSFSRNATEASVIAQSRLEELQALTNVTAVPPVPADTAGCNPIDVAACTTAMAALPNDPPNGVLDGTGKVYISAPPPTAIYTRKVAWNTITGLGSSVRQVRVDVSWTDAGGRAHSVTNIGVRLP